MPTIVSHVWKPSGARVITIDSFVPVPRGSAATAPAPMSWPSKDPGDVLDYQLNIAPALVGNEDDAINGVDVAIEPNQPGDLALTNILADGGRVVLWLSAGQAGTTYQVTAKVELASGRVVQRTVLLPVLQLTNVTVPTGSLEASADTPLTDENGNPILFA